MKLLIRMEFRRPLIILVALALINLAFYAILVYPLQSAAIREEDDYMQTRNRLASLKAKASLAKTVQDSSSAIGELTGRLPARNGLPYLIRDIHGVAREFDLRIPNVTYEPQKVKGEALTSLTITFPVEGNYPDIRRFIHEMETSDRLLMIEDIGISSSARETATTNLQMKLRTYLRSDSAGPDSDGQDSGGQSRTDSPQPVKP